MIIWCSEDGINVWDAPRPEQMRRGRPCLYSKLLIEISHTLRLVYKQPLRQTESFIKSIVTFLHRNLIVPDHTTLSRLARKQVVILDGTGLKVFGEKNEYQT